MRFKLIDQGASLTTAQVDRIEDRLGMKLPDEYRNFLLDHNGGTPEPRAFPIVDFDKNPKGLVQVFFRIDDGIESSRLDWNYKVFKGRIPKELFPIACDDGGGLICLTISGTNVGAIYYWDFYGETRPPTFDNVYPVAGSLGEFFDSIHEWDPLGEVDVQSMIVERNLPH